MQRLTDPQYLSRIHAMPCVVCAVLRVDQETRTFAHHIRTGQGGAQRASDYLAIPLCWEHHQGRSGIHGDRSAWRLAKLTETDALALTIRRMTRGADASEPEDHGETRSLDQNARMWAALTDLSKQVDWPVDGRLQKLSREDWKDILTAGLVQHQRVASGTSGGFVILGQHTRRMSKRRMGDLITLIDAFGAEHGVQWTDPEWVALVAQYEHPQLEKVA